MKIFSNFKKTLKKANLDPKKLFIIVAVFIVLVAIIVGAFNRCSSISSAAKHTTTSAVYSPNPEETSTPKSTAKSSQDTGSIFIENSQSERNKANSADDNSHTETIYPEVVTESETVLYSDTGNTVIRDAKKNEIFHLIDDDNIFWFLVRDDNGTEGYIYSEDLSFAGEEGGEKTSALYSEIKIRLSELQAMFPDQKYWNHIDIPEDKISPLSVTETPCDHFWEDGVYCNQYNGSFLDYYEEYYGYDTLYQCLGFANYISDYIFGTDAPIVYSEGFDGIQIGDHLRLVYYDHSMIVTHVGDDGINVVEVNRSFEDCLIEWDRYISFDELYSYGYDGVEYMSRYLN